MASALVGVAQMRRLLAVVVVVGFHRGRARAIKSGRRLASGGDRGAGNETAGEEAAVVVVVACLLEALLRAVWSGPHSLVVRARVGPACRALRSRFMAGRLARSSSSCFMTIAHALPRAARPAATAAAGTRKFRRCDQVALPPADPGAAAAHRVVAPLRGRSPQGRRI